MLTALFLTLTTLGAASASAIKPRQNGGGVVASNIPSRDPYNEPARGQGRRVLLYGRPDLALTVLGDPAVGTAVGIRYALEVTDSNSNRQLFETNVHDDDDEPNQFDYNDDDELRVRGTQLCVTMSGNNAFTLQNCDDSRDDDVNWVQDWEFDEPQGPKSWVHIEDDDDDNDTAQLTLSACSNDNEAQRFYQELPGEGSNAIVAPSGASSSQGGSATGVSSSAGGGGTPTQSAGPTTTSNPSTNLPNSTPTNAAGRRANMWGASFFRLLAEL